LQNETLNVFFFAGRFIRIHLRFSTEKIRRKEERITGRRVRRKTTNHGNVIKLRFAGIYASQSLMPARLICRIIDIPYGCCALDSSYLRKVPKQLNFNYFNLKSD
jgi:hypothetical protein